MTESVVLKAKIRGSFWDTNKPTRCRVLEKLRYKFDPDRLDGAEKECLDGWMDRHGWPGILFVFKCMQIFKKYKK